MTAAERWAAEMAAAQASVPDEGLLWIDGERWIDPAYLEARPDFARYLADLACAGYANGWAP